MSILRSRMCSNVKNEEWASLMQADADFCIAVLDRRGGNMIKLLPYQS